MKKFVFILLILSLMTMFMLAAGCTSQPEEKEPVVEEIPDEPEPVVEPEPEPEPESPAVEEQPLEEVVEEIIEKPKEPLPTGYSPSYQLDRAEYESMELPSSMPTNSLNLVGVYGKEEMSKIQIMDQKIYVFNFPSDLEAEFFFQRIYDRFANSDKYALKREMIGSLEVYFRYDKVSKKHEGSFFLDSKNVYYVKGSFTEDGEKKFIGEKFQ